MKKLDYKRIVKDIMWIILFSTITIFAVFGIDYTRIAYRDIRPDERQAATCAIIILILFAIIFCIGVSLNIRGVGYYMNPTNDVQKKELLKYTFLDNSILLTTDTINKNGFVEVWRQENAEHSIQILCFNEKTEEFRAFDRYHWMDEPRVVVNPPTYFIDENGCPWHSENLEPDGVYYKEDLWTPIKLHYTAEWLRDSIRPIE